MTRRAHTAAAHDATSAAAHHAHYRRPTALARELLHDYADHCLCGHGECTEPGYRFADAEGDDTEVALCRAHYGCEECGATTADSGREVPYRECEQRLVCVDCWGGEGEIELARIVYMTGGVR